jgi:hypothetical protein
MTKMVLPRKVAPEKGYTLLHFVFCLADSQKTNILGCRSRPLPSKNVSKKLNIDVETEDSDVGSGRDENAADQLRCYF